MEKCEVDKTRVCVFHNQIVDERKSKGVNQINKMLELPKTKY